MDTDKPLIKYDLLNQIFLKHDENKDGKVNPQQTLNILNQIGFNDVYLGSVKKIHRLLNNQDYPNQSEQIDFNQLEEYALAKETLGRFQLWKGKLQILQKIKQGNKDLFGQEYNNEAAPGQSNSQQNFGPQNSQQGQLLIKIGQGSNYSQRIYATLQKMPSQELKPFARISIDRPSNQAAKKTEQLFKNLQETVLQILSNQTPDWSAQIESIKLITNTNGSTFNLFITTSNQYILEFLKVLGQFLDRLIKDALKGKISLQYLFNFDINKFVTDPNSSFYSLMTKNCKLNVKWNVFQLFRTLREITLKSHSLQNLKYNKSDQFENFLIGLLHLQEFSGKLQFQNVDQNAVEQLSSKQQISNMLKGLQQSIQYLQTQGSMKISELIKQLDGKIKIQVMLGQWKLNGQVQVKDIPKLFTESLQVNEENQY